MKYEIEYACGHTGTVQLFGKTADRERKVKWLKTQLCPACEKAEREKRYDAEAKEAKEKADELGLPELQGSEKMEQLGFYKKSVLKNWVNLRRDKRE